MGKFTEGKIVSQCIYDVLNRNVTCTHEVENLECIKEVEIRFQSCLNFDSFTLSFQENLIFDHFGEFLLFNSVEASVAHPCFQRNLSSKRVNWDLEANTIT